MTQGLITVNIKADEREIQVKTTPGSLVQEALMLAQISLGELDRVEPALYTVLSDGDNILVVRIREEYYIEQKIIPFEHQELLNEGLPEGEHRISQPGVNGLQEITYHRVFENGTEVSNSIVKTTVLQPAIAEIVMVGNRSSFAAVTIPGKIAFLSAGNAWTIEGTTAKRQLVVSTGDLDGRIFSLSPDGKYLLFSRFLTGDQEINSLWVALLTNDPPKLVDLGIKNIVHFAEFNPSSSVIAYSTVEWRETAPGWQANNDLYTVELNPYGIVGKPKLLLGANSGGVYGWWGTEFSWAPDGEKLLSARPDGISVFDINDKTSTPIFNIDPYQTGGDWAWVPGSSWSPDGKLIYSIDHRILTAIDTTITQQFNLMAIPLPGGLPINLADNVGMFASPIPSPALNEKNFINTTIGTHVDQETFSISYLQAIFPDQSETSGYRIIIIDRDGSNRTAVFPGEGAVGLEPQQLVWSPESISMEAGFSLAFLSNGNIWMISTLTGATQQITGDGLTSKIDWR